MKLRRVHFVPRGMARAGVMVTVSGVLQGGNVWTEEQQRQRRQQWQQQVQMRQLLARQVPPRLN